MKTFRLIGMALLALCVTFASCSSDDEETTKNEDGIVTNQKRLVELRMTEEMKYPLLNILTIVKAG